MKKLSAIVFILSCAAILLAGCTKDSAYQPTEAENVSISISDVSRTGALVTIKDTNEEPYLYGEWYAIEKETNGQWQEVETVISNFSFTSIGYIPDENGEVEFAIDWEWLYGELPAGNYRLLKEVNFQPVSVPFSIS